MASEPALGVQVQLLALPATGKTECDALAEQPVCPCILLTEHMLICCDVSMASDLALCIQIKLPALHAHAPGFHNLADRPSDIADASHVLLN